MKTLDKDKIKKTDVKDMDKAPFSGYVILDDNTYRWCAAGSLFQSSLISLKSKPVAFVESKEEACLLTGNDFFPYGASSDEFSKSTLSELDKREKQIKASVAKIDSSFETIAFNLYWINARKAYIAKKCSTIVGYSEKTFGYAKTTCYSLLGVVDRFAERDADGNLLEKFVPLVKGYSVSKLSLMTGLTDDQIKDLKPEMSVREIKKYVKGLEGKPLPAPVEGAEEPAADETPDDAGTDNGNIVDSTAKEVNRNVLITCKGSDDYGKKSSSFDGLVARVLKAHPDAIIEVSYTLP